MKLSLRLFDGEIAEAAEPVNDSGQAEENTEDGNNAAEGEVEAKAAENKRESFRRALFELHAKKQRQADNVLSLAARLYNAEDLNSLEAAVKSQLENNSEAGTRKMLKTLERQSKAVKELYPDFDLKQSLCDRKFFSLCYKGVDLQTAYEITHLDEIISAAMAYAAQELIRAGAGERLSARPREGALLSSGEPVGKKPKNLTKKERSELIARTERGERVTLS